MGFFRQHVLGDNGTSPTEVDIAGKSLTVFLTPDQIESRFNSARSGEKYGTGWLTLPTDHGNVRIHHTTPILIFSD